MNTNADDTTASWNRYRDRLIRYHDTGFSIDFSRMEFGDDFPGSMESKVAAAFEAMEQLEAGEIANPDENRMVGHYWLRKPDLAPEDLQGEIRERLAEAKDFAAAVHAGEIAAPNGQPFKRVLLVGIGGSALGPQLLADALTGPDAPMTIHFFDNTDPDGIDRVLAEIGDDLGQTLTVVISKSGGTKETRNGMLEAANAYQKKGLKFADHAVAVTGEGSQLDQQAASDEWIRQFHMSDWVGGRTSIMSVVGLVPCALLGIDVDAFLKGAAAMDARTREPDLATNAAMMQALAWHAATNGRGEKDMVVLPYKDRLLLLSKYLQQLVMESLGKERDLDGNVVNQGISVYGNKGSTDQHAYVQQLRDGVNNFFAVFIEVRKAREARGLEVEPGVTSGDYLQGFFRGTRSALAGSGRQSITISLPEINAFQLGAVIALFERTVGFYASLVNINAYHQPGVEAGKKAAGDFLSLLGAVQQHLVANPGEAMTAATVAATLSLGVEDTYHALTHLAANLPEVEQTAADDPDSDTFRHS